MAFGSTEALARLISVLIIAFFAAAPQSQPSAAQALYIANMGAMVQRNDVKVLFDPLFHYEHDTYQRVPADFETAMLAGTEPFDGIDAVFISHHHGDHFDPSAILALLRAQPAIRLFAPEQAAAAIRARVSNADDPVHERINSLTLDNGEVAVDVRLDSLLVEAVRIPHSGWPEYHANVQNLVFRVTLDDDTTVMHFGDAAAVDDYYVKQSGHWDERRTHFAMSPYWFFLSDEGLQILEERTGVDYAVGMHLPASVTDEKSELPEELRDTDLLTRPGETRTIQIQGE